MYLYKPHFNYIILPYDLASSHAVVQKIWWTLMGTHWNLLIKTSEFVFQFFEVWHLWFYSKGKTSRYTCNRNVTEPLNCINTTAWKVFKYGVISSPYFPVFGLNTAKYVPENNSVFGKFSRSVLWIIYNLDDKNLKKYYLVYYFTSTKTVAYKTFKIGIIHLVST